MKVALLGIGLMGLPMARRLLGAGFELSVWNRTPDKCSPLIEEGASLLDELSQIEAFDVIITMLADGDVVETVLKQIAPHLSSIQTVIDMSSTSLEQVKRISELINQTGAFFIDAPVSGGVPGAEKGTLAIMAGSDSRSSFERVLPILSSMGRATRVGKVGSGQLSKLANQAIVGGTIGIVAEAVLMLEQAGVDPVAFRDALSGGFADSLILQLHGKKMTERSFAPGGKVMTQLKDEKNIIEAARHFNLELPITEAILKRYETLSQDPACAELDHSALFIELLQRNQLS